MTDTSATASVAPTRESLFGVCAAIARDFGFNPLWLRLGFAFGLLVRFDAALVAYGVLALAVLASRVATLRLPRRTTLRRTIPSAVVTPVPSRAHGEMALARAA